MIKRSLLLRALMFLFVLGILMLIPNHALASAPADLAVGAGFLHYDGNRYPIAAPIHVAVVDKWTSNGIHIPIGAGDYAFGHLNPNYPAWPYPSTNVMDFATDELLQNHIFGGQYGMRDYNNLIWCGSSVGVPDKEFEMDVSVQALPNDYNFNGTIYHGKWIGYWHYESGNPITDQAVGFNGTSTRVPALNPHRTFVYFEFQADPPKFNVGGNRFDRWGNTDGPWSGAEVYETANNWLDTWNPYNFNDMTVADNHEVQARSINNWDPMGYRITYDHGASWGTGNGSAYGFPANTRSRGDDIWLDWMYEPIQSVINAGVRVRNDSSGGSGYNICNNGQYQSTLCGNVGMSANANSSPNFGALGFVKSYNATVGPVYPNASSAAMGGLYLGWHRVSVNVPAGFKIVGWVVDGTFNSGWTQPYYDYNIDSANKSATVEPVLEPQTITLRGSKRGPGTFINQNSATTDVVNGTVTVNGTQVSGNGGGQTSYSTTLRYNSGSGNNGINVTADTGWQIRGYSFCTGTPTAPNCHNDAVQAPNNATSGSIILVNNGDGGDTLNLNIDYSTPTPTINGAALGSDVWLNVYLKPKPIDVQVKAWINQQGGSNQKINPCDQSDYKKQICDDSRIRAVRVNTATSSNNIANTNANVEDLGDPAGGSINTSCSSTDYIPTKPGYNYTNFGNYFCALKDTGGTTGASGTGFISYGQTLDVDAATGGISTNADPAENNAAIFRNVYPGKYSFQADDTPDNGGVSGAGWTGVGCPTGGESCVNNPLVSTPGIGVSGNPELAYEVGQSTCDINTTGCQNTKTVINNSGGCKLDHRRKAYSAFFTSTWWGGFWTTVIGLNGQASVLDDHGETKCTIMSGGSVADNYYASPETWNPSFNWNSQRPARCHSSWADTIPRNWDMVAGKYGVNVYNGGPCGYRKDATTSVYTYSMGIVPDNAVNGIGQNGKALREQNFIYTPKIKTTQGTLTCDTYTAKLAFMPDPSRPVDSYFRIAAPSLTNLLDSSNNPIIVSTPGGNGADAHDVVLHIPKYNGTGANRLLKDGIPRDFEHFARFGSADPALVNGYSASAADWSTGGYKYTPTRVFNGVGPNRHVCTNNATCDNTDFNNQLSQYSTIDVDDTSTIRLNVKMTNTGESYWMRNVNENGASNTTNHQLVVTGGTARSINGSNGWLIGDEELRMPDGSHVYPISPVDDDGDPVAITNEDEVEFEITPEPPRDGGSKYTIGFRMVQYVNGNPNEFGTSCEGDLEIKVSYKPWLRVQNGNVTALGKIVDQSERSRGVYKSETHFPTPANPYGGSVQYSGATTPGTKPDLNLHAQFSVAAEEGGENFCSTNFYMLGIANPPNSFTPNAPQQNRNCNFGGMELNIESTTDDNNDGRKELKNDSIYGQVAQHFSAPGSTEAYGQCVDTSSNLAIEEGLSGPYELSQAYKYYRSWWPDSAHNAQNLVWALPNGPMLFNGSIDGDGPFGKSLTAFNLTNAAPNGRPCPTVFQLTTGVVNPNGDPDLDDSRVLGGFSVASGRSTILSDKTVYITDNIYTDLNGTYKFQRGDGSIAPDIAGLNSLPNLGIIADGDIVIASNVDEIDASLYATGKIITCDKYNLEPGMNEDASKTDKAGTTGSKWIRHGSNVTDANPLKNEIDDPNVVEPSTADNSSAAGCNQRLRITGSVTAGTSFKFGRNYMDFAGMVARWSHAQPGAFGLYGKYCNKSTATPAANFQRACTVLGATRDFDSPENAGTNYLLAYNSGYPQNYYTGGPAEDFIGNGLASFIPPPGFENLTGSLQSAKYVSNSVKPQF